ncbi:MAG: hypothetical protein J0M24_00660 [Verrucomicrobia bacterium]|nr:hypothetical protein [Verrucomicrobiota bacterium]
MSLGELWNKASSRLPLVVYVPEGVEVQYRIWRADGKASTAKEG